MKINIAVAGGPCTGKSTLAAALFAKLKIQGFDYDLITEEVRKLKTEFGHYRNPFERLYMWRQQEREELRSSAKNGFITDTPLFLFYISARQWAKESRDKLAVRELFRMCLEIENRYQLIVLIKNSREIPYKNDKVRTQGEGFARARHDLIESFLKHFVPEKLLLVEGGIELRTSRVIQKLKKMYRARKA
ncbi:MAG: AAA family ATPase [Candidatus Portnoybacteria bacterium]|nr:AAA family ATPase [Candidatus Portnoybacteria bacterium]